MEKFKGVLAIKRLYYVCKNGSYVTDYDLKKCFLISTGMDSSLHEGAYINFLDSFLKTTLNFDPAPTVEKLAKAGNIALAIELCRDELRCTLMEAKAVVATMTCR